MFKRIGTDYESISQIPQLPGVYRFINNNQEILYIGASGNLQKRVSQYFRKTSDQNHNLLKIKKFTRFIEFQKYGDVESAFEAERIEIWTNQPALNIRGNSVHSFSYLIVRKIPFIHILCCDEEHFSKITNRDNFYRINTHLKDLIEKLGIIRRKLPFCLFPQDKSCWDYQLHLCMNNCNSNSDDSDSKAEINLYTLINNLSSKESALRLQWKKYIADYASNLQFEKAGKYQAALDALESLRRNFGGQSSLRKIDQFSFNFNKKNCKNITVQITSFLEGENIVRKQESIQGNERYTTEILVLYFLVKYYRNIGSLPSEVHIDYPLPEKLQSSFQKRMRRFYHRPIGIKIIDF
ncbi:MAG: GIY-YIG nuclease family protein [Candidatus Hodarchaeales archaeon]